jgi:anaerobic selenocysteine-containing dehydrogenase
MAKKLKIWNGRSPRQREYKGSVYVAAYSQKHAKELIEKAFSTTLTTREIPDYYHSGSWGNPMDGIEPTEPCVYVQETYSSKPIRLI